MGTLTANQQRLPGYCEHKLPTSCRLTSIPECCACADERAHAAAYSTYIDGVGYVLRGNRWQRYCWFCREFWTNRVDISGLRPAQTRIPTIPDQTDFLKRWYEFHQGYRIVLKEDGSEDHIAVNGEDFREVSPGHLPRTIEELRSGRERSEFEEQERRAETAADNAPEATQGPGLDEALEQMFNEAEAEETLQQMTTNINVSSNSNNIHAQAMTIGERSANVRSQEYQARRTAALRRELHRMRNGIERVISGLRELGEHVPDQTEATGRLTQLGNTLDAISGGSRISAPAIPSDDSSDATTSFQHNSGRVMSALDDRVAEAQAHLASARSMRDQAASELETAEQELRTSQRRVQQLQREQRTAENYTRLFGTREEMAAQGENYVSPIGGLFDQAEQRHRAAESVRREERTLRRYLAEEEIVDAAASRRLEELARMRQRADVWGVPRALNGNTATRALQHQGTSNTTRLMEMARDEVFTGSFSSTDRLPIDTVQSDSAERYMDQVYSQLRRQGWSQRMIDDYPQQSEQNSNVSGQDSHNLAERIRSLQMSIDADISILTPAVYDPTYASYEADLRFIIKAIVDAGDNSDLINASHWHMNQALFVQQQFEENPHFSVHDASHRHTLRRLHENEELIWLVGLPTERMRRCREAGQRLIISQSPQSSDLQERSQNIEVMAVAYQISSTVRGRTELPMMQQLQMLYRLQAGTRTQDDRECLLALLADPQAVFFARSATESNQERSSPPSTIWRPAELGSRRPSISPTGSLRIPTSTSPPEIAELPADTSSHDIAVAAGRRAMQTGPQGVMDAMLSWEVDYRNDTRDEIEIMEARRAAHFVERLRMHQGESDTEPEDDDLAVGLDAADSGRPEPKNEDEMTVRLDCQICYSQFADTACLPCGHLVMCKWCSDQHSPTMMQDRTRPRRPANCPVCRKGIKQKVRIYRA